MIERIDIAAFERLEGEWNTLLRASKSNCFFLTWEWLNTWWKHLAGRRELFLLRVTSGNELVGLLPLAVAPAELSRCAPRSIELLGGGSVGSDYLDFIIREGCEPDVLPEAASYLLRQKLALRFTQQDRQSSCASRLAACWREQGGALRAVTTNVCPIIKLAGHTWDSYLGTLGAEHRYNFRRRLKQLSARFAMRFEMVRSEEERGAALSRLLHLHNLRRSKLGGSDAFHSSALVGFHEDLTRLALQRGWLRLFTLWLDEEPAASLYGFFYDGIFYFYQTGFDPRFNAFSVGLVTMGLAIQRAIEEGARQYDMLHGAERYKFHWARDVRELSCLELYPPGWRGALWKSVRDWNASLRTMARKMLPSTRMAVATPAVSGGGDDAYAAGRS